ncbi:MAG: hypothetical protein IMY72_11680 [Bacteroidetes bacterium]|nr:hypothetical protein [Bacteroidota bacterium]
MKINLQQPIKQINGKTLIDEQNKEVLLKSILLTLAILEKEDEVEKKLLDFDLAIKIQNSNSTLELKNEELVRIQQKAKGFLSTLVLGQVNAILEGHENPIK